MSAEYTADDLNALFDEIRNRITSPGDTPATPLVDWAELFARERTDTDWLAAPLIPAGRSVALFAKGGTGKSLLVLWIAAALAAGRPIFGTRRPPLDVLYLDYEMTEDDLLGRLESMGYTPDDLTHLHYALLPQLAPLDNRAGGEAVAALAAGVDAQLVIIDTFGRAVSGDENEADTVRAWYRWTGSALKRDGRAFVRVDHAGKDIERGQRGSSAKNDDVDIVWQMTALDAKRFRLTATKRRLDSVPESVEIDQRDDDYGLTYRLVVGDVGYPAGTARVADDLDRLGVELDISRRKAEEALQTAGVGARCKVVGAALKYRRERALKVVPEAQEPVPGDKSTGTTGNHSEQTHKPAGNGTASGSRNHREPVTEFDGGSGWLPVGEPLPPEPTRLLFDNPPTTTTEEHKPT